jgi:hypothetical protein
MDKTILTIFKIISLIFIALAVILTAFFAVIFPVIFMIQNPKNSLKILGSIVVLVIIGFVCYSIAKNTLNIEQLEQLKTTAETSKMVGAALYFTYIIGSLTVLSVIFSSVSGFFK